MDLKVKRQKNDQLVPGQLVHRLPMRAWVQAYPVRLLSELLRFRSWPKAYPIRSDVS